MELHKGDDFKHALITSVCVPFDIISSVCQNSPKSSTIHVTASEFLRSWSVRLTALNMSSMTHDTFSYMINDASCNSLPSGPVLGIVRKRLHI